MNDLIDRKELTIRIGRKLSVGQTDAEMADVIAHCIEDAPAVDAVPVVRCKDCKYSRMYCFGCSDEPVLACCEIEEDDDGYEFIRAASSVDPEGFCSEGERP